MDKPKDNTNPGTDNPQGAAAKPGRRHLIKRRWLRCALKTLGGVLVVLILLPTLLYIPFIQNAAKNLACDIINEKTGMHASIGRFSLRFPLNIGLSDVLILDAQKDTLIKAADIVADVKLLPLFNLDAQINKLSLTDGYYCMISEDSSMIVGIHAGQLNVSPGASFNMNTQALDIKKAHLKDTRISLFMDVWKQKASADTAANPMKITCRNLTWENMEFAMSMLPTIDTLNLVLDKGELHDGIIDLSTNNIKARLLAATGGKATYLTPTPEYIASHPLPPDTIPASAPMIVRADSISLSGISALYAVKGATPMPGFDPSFMSVNDVSISMKDFYNESSTVRLPIKSIAARERSGLEVVRGSGLVAVDSTGITLAGLDVYTLYSHLTGDADIPFALMELNPKARMNVDAHASLGIPDINAFMPALKPATKLLPQRDISLDIAADGALENLRIENFFAEMPSTFTLSASGNVGNPLDFKKLHADIDFDATLSNPEIADAFIGTKGIYAPAFTLSGTATAENMNFGADFTLNTSAGDFAAKGNAGLNPEVYFVDARLEEMDVAKIMPDLGVGIVTATLYARGQGFNPSKPGADADIRLNVEKASYQGHLYTDISLEASLAEHNFTANAISSNPHADFTLRASGTLFPNDYTIDAGAHINNIDLQALGLSETTNSGSGDIVISGTAHPDSWLYDIDLYAERIDWNLPDNLIHLPNGIKGHFTAEAQNVDCRFSTDGAEINFQSSTGLKNVIDSFLAATEMVQQHLKEKKIEIEPLQQSLPPFALSLTASGEGVLKQFIQPEGISIDTIYASFSNTGLLSGKVGIGEFNHTNLKLDTITFNVNQRGRLLDYVAHIGNRKGTFDEFAKVDLKGYFGGSRLSANITQKNIEGKTGYRLGMTAAMRDSVVSVHLTPLNATIAYMPWSINEDNYIDYNFAKPELHADMTATTQGSSITIKTEPDEKQRNTLLLDMHNIRVQDFLRLSMFAPPVEAAVDSKLRITYIPTHKAVIGRGNLDVRDFSYNKLKVGNFSLNLGAGLNLDGSTAARAALSINNHESLILRGIVRSDSLAKAKGKQPVQLTLILNKFPLDIANPFLGKDLATLRGALNGEMKVAGSLKEPLLNGHIACDSVGVRVAMIGTELKFSPNPIRVDSNVLRFNNFSVLAANANPMSLNGVVDASNLADVSFDLKLKAANMQLIGSDRRSRSDIYGKLFLNLDGFVRGPLKHFDVNVKANILSPTDVTYNLASSPSEMARQNSGDVVEFVNLSDTTSVEKADSVAPANMAMRIIAALTISPGAKATVNLSTNGTDKVELSPSGTLNYFQNYMGDMRLNGQLSLGEGFARYNVPVVGEKKFTLTQPSYVLWNGDMMNPTLSINATNNIRSSVTQASGNSRLVNFLVSLAVTGTLEHPKVMFDLSTNDDISIQNELQSMSPDQRSSEAMNMLLYGRYMGSSASAINSNLLSGQLNSFLASQLNSWAANNIRGIDLSFGIDQYNTGTNGQNSSATSYSYQVSKSLFNNRFKIVVGGNYNTDANADENFSQNLINDISFEYTIKQTQNLSMLLKLFRHTGFESILEGEVTQTGVAFEMRRRLDNLLHMFRMRFGKRKKQAEAIPTNVNPEDSAAIKNPVDSINQTSRSITLNTYTQ